MRSLKTGLVAIAISGLLTTAAVVGCSADGSGIVGEINPTETPEAGATLPPTLGDDDDDDQPAQDAGKDSGKKDSGKAETGVDAGPPPPVPGTACTVDGETKSKECGACGKQETVCLADGAGFKWSEYGVCGAELAGGCIPGTTVDEPCGNCGTVKKTCTKYCAYTSGACTGQPALNCKPGTTEYTTAGCSTAATYRNRTCADTCTWGSFTLTCEAPNNPNKLTASATIGGVVTGTYELSAAALGKRISGSCTGSPSVYSSAVPVFAVEVTNPTAQTATVQLYNSSPGTPVDTYMWAYDKTLPPTDDASLKACKFGGADSCLTGDPCGNTAGGGSSLDLAGIDNVTIPPNGKILVYTAGYLPADTGTVRLNIKTTKLM